MPKVFVSSTTTDLSEHRKAIIAAIRRLDGYQCVCMEDFGARDWQADDFCRAKVSECDVFVGILGHFYGSCPNGSQLSFTEREYDKAVETAKPRLMFLAADNFPMPANVRETEEKWHAQQTFRRRGSEERIRETFLLPEELALKVTQAIRNWEQDSSLKSHGIKPGLLPVMPTIVVGRDEALRELKTRLGVAGKKQETAPTQILTAVRGWPGVGKTTIAAALAHDPDTRKAFPDGVLWTSLGQKPDVLSELATWGRALGTDDLLHCRDLTAATTCLAGLLWNRRMLLIVDDAWEAEHAIPFKAGGAGCAMLVTTRVNSVAQAIAPTSAHIYTLAVLTDEKALELLKLLAPAIVAQFPEQSLELVRELEGLPLAIQVAGRLLNVEASYGFGVSELLAELRAGAKLLEAKAPADRADLVNETIPTIAALLQKSTDRLDPETRERFAYLGAFAPKPATFDLKAMKAVWKAEDPKLTVRILVDRGLLEPIVESGRFQVHALLVLHARSLCSTS